MEIETNYGISDRIYYIKPNNPPALFPKICAGFIEKIEITEDKKIQVIYILKSGERVPDIPESFIEDESIRFQDNLQHYMRQYVRESLERVNENISKELYSKKQN